VSHRLRNASRVSVLFVAFGFLALQVLQAYEVPLTPAVIHEAYVLGRRNDQATSDFFNAYVKQLAAGAEQSDITQIEILTPFAQVVDLSRRNATANYTEEQAADDYRRQGDKIIVHITLMLPAAYAAVQKSLPETPTSDVDKDALRPENFWQNFRFALKHSGKVIATRSISNHPVHSASTKEAPSVLDGAVVWLEYDAKDVASEPVTVEVLTPKSQTISTMFDLKKLR